MAAEVTATGRRVARELRRGAVLIQVKPRRDLRNPRVAPGAERGREFRMLSHPDSGATLPDITSRADLERLVHTFYARVQHDDLLGFIFSEVAKTDWTAHLPRMVSFWETVILGAGTYQGNPLAAHARLTAATPMGRPQFDRWLALFTATVDELFAGEKAGHLKRAAEDMAHVIHARINHVPDARFDPANLTPEQRARYAKYRAATPAPGA